MTDQPSLFDAAYARRTDPDTSHIAALTVDATRLERLVASVLQQHPEGCTVKELSDILGVDKWSLSPRMKPMETKGMVNRTDERRGRSIVWKLV